MCEVMYLDDITQNGYLKMATKYLDRSNIASELIGEDQILSKSLQEVRNEVKRFWMKSFYSQKMLKHTIWEETAGHGASEFVFPDDEKLTGNIFAGEGGFTVTDNELRQTLLNMPMDISTLGKHRFGMFLEVFRFIYDLLGMHLSIRRAYVDTFLSKCEQFVKYFQSVKDSKVRLQDNQVSHKLRLVNTKEKLKEIKESLAEREQIIVNKTKENELLQEDLEHAEAEVQGVLSQKDDLLSQILLNLERVNRAEFSAFLVADAEFTEA